MAERGGLLTRAVHESGLRPAATRAVAQLLCYIALGLLLGYCSATPYRYVAPGAAVLKLSFDHAGAHVTACRRRSPAELAALAPNMRQVAQCPRARVAVRVELDLDGQPLYGADLPPAGLAKDGESSIYQRFTLRAGKHRLAMRLRDSRRRAGFDYAREIAVELAPGGVFVIDFNAKAGGFQFPIAAPLRSAPAQEANPAGGTDRRVAAPPQAAIGTLGAMRIALARGHRSDLSR